ncbi:MAG: VRR-NUC domain-containing protein [Natronospirillum sp.]|uniref:VRR-NUC domain-containing protein n=1 Tax=Natronospirillum sp. TaxID=2812955 RepID=UPI0025DBCD49|nr:VRR-NUC domain-containing protein [Natronospirillum sp.]MCH8552135.1 VRR-NUC domain-containing protein [Natronospirillum sp.]
MTWPPSATPGTLADPLYYLHNFRFVLDWVVQRYPDLLSDQEQSLIGTLRQLPEPTQALLVRMVMRKGIHFRADRLDYQEIGTTEAAAAPLLEAGLVSTNPRLAATTLGSLLTVAELRQLAALHCPGGTLARIKRKRDLVETLQRHCPEDRCWIEWWPDAPTALYELRIMAFCDRMRLMFFGSLRQEWSTFVLAELGLFRYESVSFDKGSRPFTRGLEIDVWLQLHQCRDRFEQGEPVATILPDVPEAIEDSAWIQARRDRLLFQLAYQLERQDDLEGAADLYRGIRAPGARQRLIRVLERQNAIDDAVALLQQALVNPESEAEKQQITRMAPRLYRKAGLTHEKKQQTPAFPEATLTLPLSNERVELAVVNQLQQPDAPVYWVENTLINALLGLLCWPVIFEPLPGAFFHPYQDGPADLYRPDFFTRRRAAFEDAISALQTPDYPRLIVERWESRQGVQNPFVHWGLVGRELLTLALACIPPTHLEPMFRRILFDVRANRSGLPDLIQFWPAQNRYRLVEVKGPGDRLQDNQIRWLKFCVQHGIPAQVLYVQRSH